MKKIFFLIVFTAQYSLTCFSQDSIHHFTDPEVIKLANYIKNLEKKAAFYIATHPDDVFVVNNAKTAEEKAVLYDLIKDSLNSYNDKQVIRIANYIKYLERLDALNTLALEAKMKYNDSIAIAGQKEIDKYEKLIFFNFDSSVLKEESYAPLDEAVKVLKKFVNSSFLIEGHTDSIGSVAYNLNLSKERAKTVMDYFVSKGIPASRISFVGYGEAKPIDTNETEAGKAKNRRVEIKLKK